MGYASKYGRRPPEFASKASHHEIIKDEDVQGFLKKCKLPSTAAEIDLASMTMIPVEDPDPNPIAHIVAVDGGYTDVFVRPEFPSARIAFFQFGVLMFRVSALDKLAESRFIFPEQMSELKNVERIKLTVPTKGVTAYDEQTLTHSFRRTLHEFCSTYADDDSLNDTLRWLLFAEFESTPESAWELASCPLCGAKDVLLERAAIAANRVPCSVCGEELYLTDAFRLHEVVDDEIGASGVLGYLTTTMEQLLIAHVLRIMLRVQPALLGQMLLIKDGPLGFFGQTANIHRPMGRLVRWLAKYHSIYLVGAEKSGAFVEHADAIADKMPAGHVLLLDNEYIYNHVVPGTGDPERPYGSTTYYGQKVILKTPEGRMYVLTVPTHEVSPEAKPDNYINLQTVLSNVVRLRCDMYDSALIPVALVNKLVSLADHPEHEAHRTIREGNDHLTAACLRSFDGDQNPVLRALPPLRLLDLAEEARSGDVAPARAHGVG